MQVKVFMFIQQIYYKPKTQVLYIYMTSNVSTLDPYCCKRRDARRLGTLK